MHPDTPSDLATFPTGTPPNTGQAPTAAETQAEAQRPVAAPETNPAAPAALAPLPEPLLFTAEQAGLLLQVPASWLRKQAAAGRVASILLGRRLLFARTDLNALIDANRRPATNGPHRFRSGH
jgi:hypothetical protein